MSCLEYIIYNTPERIAHLLAIFVQKNDHILALSLTISTAGSRIHHYEIKSQPWTCRRIPPEVWCLIGMFLGSSHTKPQFRWPWMSRDTLPKDPLDKLWIFGCIKLGRRGCFCFLNKLYTLPGTETSNRT